MESTLRLQVLLQAIDKASAPLRNIGRSGKEASKELRDTLTDLRKLKTQQDALGKFQQAQAALKGTSEQLATMRQRVQELREAGRSGTALLGPNYAKDMAQAEREAARLTQHLAAQANTVRDLKGRLATLGIDQVTGAEQRLAEAMAQTNRQADTQRARLLAITEAEKRLQSTRERAGQLAAAGVGATAAGTATLTPIVAAVREFTKFEDAMLGIARQVNGARSPTGELTAIYWDMARQVHQLGREIPLATTEIADMVTAGARMEVPTEQLAAYTRTAAMMAIAFDAVPAHIAEQMGKVGKNFRIPLTDIGALADSINYLDDNAISKGDEIIDVLNRISGVVSTVAMSAKDAAALSSTLLTLGERPETAATAVNAIVQKFAAATKGTKKFQQAVREIGLDSGQIQTGMSKDATGTLINVIDAIRKLPEAKRVGVMVELVGLEHSDTLAKLVTKPEELARQRELANGLAAQGSMAREAAARADTLSARWQIFQNRMFEVSSTLGENLKPALVDIMDTIGGVLENVTAWTKAHPELTSFILKTAAAVGVFMLFAGGLLLSISSVLGPLALLRYSWAILIAKSPLLATAIDVIGIAVRGLGAVMLSNPIGLAITALVATLWYLWSNWDNVKALFAQSWEVLTSVVSGNIDHLIDKIRNLSKTIQDLMPPGFGSTPWGFLWKVADWGVNLGKDTPPIDTRKPLPATGAGAGRGSVNPGGPVAINVYPSPGMDEAALARLTRAEMERYNREQAARGRSSLRDRD